MKIKYILYCCVIISFFCCKKKYENNPLINLSSKENRLEGTYYLGEYKIDGTESTVKLDSGLTLNEFNFFIDHKTYPSSPPVIGGNYFNGSCERDEHKKKLVFYLSNTCFKDGPLSEHGAQKYRITKLTKHQLGLEMMYQNKKYNILFLQK